MVHTRRLAVLAALVVALAAVALIVVLGEGQTSPDHSAPPPSAGAKPGLVPGPRDGDPFLTGRPPEEGSPPDTGNLQAPAGGRPSPTIEPTSLRGYEAHDAALQAFRRGDRELGIRLLEAAVPGIPPGLGQQEVRIDLVCALLAFGGAKKALEYVAAFFADAAEHSTLLPGKPLSMRSIFGRRFRTYPKELAGMVLLTQEYAHSRHKVGAPIPGPARPAPELHCAAEVRRRLEALPPAALSADERTAFEALAEFTDLNAEIRAEGLAREEGLRTGVRDYVSKYASSDDAHIRRYVAWMRQIFAPD